MKISEITGNDSYFEDFVVGQVIRHARGKTVTELENVLITNLVMNSADGHFNEHRMQNSSFKSCLSYGGVNLSLVFGLATQDTAENALSELGIDKIRFVAPVFHGDTVYAVTEVLEVSEADRPDAGVVRFVHTGINQHDKVVVQGERRVLIKRRSHWGGR
ncbi:MAG: MaoC family dehydratase [Cupriavidus necator]